MQCHGSPDDNGTVTRQSRLLNLSSPSSPSVKRHSCCHIGPQAIIRASPSRNPRLFKVQKFKMSWQVVTSSGLVLRSCRRHTVRKQDITPYSTTPCPSRLPKYSRGLLEPTNLQEWTKSVRFPLNCVPPMAERALSKADGLQYDSELVQRRNSDPSSCIEHGTREAALLEIISQVPQAGRTLLPPHLNSNLPPLTK